MSQILVVPCPRYVRNKNRSEINLGMAFCQSSPSLHQPRLTLPPSPEQQRRIKRAREALDGMGRLDRVPRVEGQKSGSITATRRTRVLAGNRPGLTPTSWSTTPDTGHPESPEQENRTMSSTSKNPGPLARKVQTAIAGTVQATPAKPARPEPAQPKPVATKPAKATEPAKVKPPKPEPAVVVTAPPKPPERKCQPRWTEPGKQGDLVWEQPGRDELTETCQNVSEIPT